MMDAEQIDASPVLDIGDLDRAIAHLEPRRKAKGTGATIKAGKRAL